MRKHPRFHRWDAAIAAYLSSRRALGRRYTGEEHVLRSLRTHFAQRGAPDLDQANFESWYRGLTHCAHNTQVDYGMIVLRFCRYRRRGEPHCFIPERNTLGRHQPYPLPAPIDDDQVVRLLNYLAHQPSERERPWRWPALRLAIVLLYTAGLRRGEVARLTLEDVDATTGVLRIRASKFHKSRWVPLSPSATQELQVYLRARRAVDPRPSATASLLCNCIGGPFSPNVLSVAIRTLMLRSGVWAGAARLARVHDFRHGFAVTALRRWYEADTDVQSNLPKLALYMGHVSIASTAYYLRFMPAVVTLASQRFHRSCGAIVDGGAS
jgi:integrase/recombinase XerD